MASGKIPNRKIYIGPTPPHSIKLALPEDLDDKAIESMPASPYVRPTTFIHPDTLLQTPPPNNDHNPTPAISQEEDTLSALQQQVATLTSAIHALSQAQRLNTVQSITENTSAMNTNTRTINSRASSRRRRSNISNCQSSIQASRRPTVSVIPESNIPPTLSPIQDVTEMDLSILNELSPSPALPELWELLQPQAMRNVQSNAVPEIEGICFYVYY